MRAIRGFTLIELLITVAIIGLLAAIAFPLMTGYMERSRRAEAVQLVGEMQLRLERWRADNPTYDITGNEAEFGALPTAVNYTVALSDADATGYTLTATAQGPQVRDTDCATMTLVRANGQDTRTPADGCW